MLDTVLQWGGAIQNIDPTGGVLSAVAAVAVTAGVAKLAHGAWRKSKGYGNYHSPSNLHGKPDKTPLTGEGNPTLGEIEHRFTGRNDRTR